MKFISWLRCVNIFGFSLIALVALTNQSQALPCFTECPHAKFVIDDKYDSNIPADALSVITEFLSEAVVTLDKPFEDQIARHNYDLIRTSFVKAFGDDFLFEKIVKKAKSEFDLKINPDQLKNSPRSRHHAMAVAFFRENVFRLSIGILRSIRQEEIMSVKNSGLSQQMKDQLLNNPLSYSIATKGLVRDLGNGAREIEIPVTLIPEVKKYGNSVTVLFTVRQETIDSKFHLHDFFYSPGIGVRNSHISTMKSIIRQASKTLDISHDIINFPKVKDGMAKWGIESAEWEQLAEEFR
jgi:hypothetical protein